jgi:hypothetical protein
MARLPAKDLYVLLNSQLAHLPFKQRTVLAFTDQKTTKVHTAPAQIGACLDEVSLAFMLFQAGNTKNCERLIYLGRISRLEKRGVHAAVDHMHFAGALRAIEFG